MRAILSIARKDLRLLFRDKGDVFFTCVFPMLMAVLFGFVFGGGGGGSKIKLALVNESDARMAVDLAADLSNDSAFEVTRMETRDEAIAAVRAGKAMAVVVLPESMREGMGAMFTGGVPIDCIVDPARRAEAGLIQGKLNELAFRQFPQLLFRRLPLLRDARFWLDDSA